MNDLYDRLKEAISGLAPDVYPDLSDLADDPDELEEMDPCQLPTH